jgi:hypothetical protein
VLDIDIDDAGQVLAVTGDGLYTVNNDGTVNLLANVSTPANTNGMAIHQDGSIYITNSDDADSQAFTVDRATGTVEPLGPLAPYRSSGDCVVTKNGSLFMASRDPVDPSYDNDQTVDTLIYIDRGTAATMEVMSLDYQRVYGLSASFDYLFGLTDGGEVFLIDIPTQEITELFADGDYRFWGAANGD